MLLLYFEMLLGSSSGENLILECSLDDLDRFYLFRKLASIPRPLDFRDLDKMKARPSWLADINWSGGT